MSSDETQRGGRVQVIRPADRDRGTAQTSGMERETAIDAKRVGSRTLWIGHVRATPGVASGVHHHGDSETGVYVIRGTIRIRFGERLAEAVEAHAGDFLYVPPNTAHQEVNPSPSEAAEAVVVRDRQENIVVPIGPGKA